MAQNTYVALQTVTGSGTTSVTFSSIPSTYTDLVLVMNGTASSATNVYLRLNGDTGSNYSMTRVVGNGSSASSDRNSNYTAFQSFVGYYDTTGGTSIIQLMNYANTSVYKTALARYNYTTNEVTGAVGLWRSTAAVNSITILTSNSATFPSSTTFTLYGVAADTGGSTPKATGGVVTSDSTYYYHTFQTSGNFVPKQSLTADILVVAGGGGGGWDNAGGGGAGGLLGFASQALTAQSYLVAVGAGGARGTTGSGFNGSDSQFGALTLVKGGGFGSGYQTSAGGNGGSGGGGGGLSGGTQAGGTATSGQGNNGGSGSTGGGTSAAGGGGGAGGAGGAGVNGGSGGAGGNGLSTYSSWASVTGTGVSGYYAGGGGGAQKNTSTAAAGGAGGGGNGGTTTLAGVDGIVSTGSGGGGGTNGLVGGNGGSGIVIVRYAK